jgi:hypothetical protein
MALAIFAVMAMITGAMPSILGDLGGKNGVIILGVGALAVGIIFAIGFVLDKQRAARESFGG